jgi:serine/threonine protein kinase
MPHPLARENCKPAVGQEFSLNKIVYKLGGNIGDGAIGIVRRVYRIKDNTEFAIKFLAPDPKYIEVNVFDDVANRFKREGERGSKIEQNFLVKIHAFCENINGSAFNGIGPTNPFILMELVKGRTTLESFLRSHDLQGKFIVDETRLLYALQIATALKYLHRHKLIHRDVKPANIFISNNNAYQQSAKLGDFGVMKWGDYFAAIGTGTYTATTQKGLGTMKYMSPEQAIKPKEVTVRSDIFSLGITFLELFTGQILATSQHVNEAMFVRMERNTTYGRYKQMGYNLRTEDTRIGELILDMHLRGASGRPSIDKICGQLHFEYEQRTGRTLESELYR